jgi:hypothetical protein
MLEVTWFDPFSSHRRGNDQSVTLGSPGSYRPCAKNSGGSATSVMSSSLISSLMMKTEIRWQGTGLTQWTWTRPEL